MAAGVIVVSTDKGVWCAHSLTPKVPRMAFEIGPIRLPPQLPYDEKIAPSPHYATIDNIAKGGAQSSTTSVGPFQAAFSRVTSPSSVNGSVVGVTNHGAYGTDPTEPERADLISGAVGTFDLVQPNVFASAFSPATRLTTDAVADAMKALDLNAAVKLALQGQYMTEALGVNRVGGSGRVFEVAEAAARQGFRRLEAELRTVWRAARAEGKSVDDTLAATFEWLKPFDVGGLNARSLMRKTFMAVEVFQSEGISDLRSGSTMASGHFVRPQEPGGAPSSRDESSFE